MRLKTFFILKFNILVSIFFFLYTWPLRIFFASFAAGVVGIGLHSLMEKSAQLGQ